MEEALSHRKREMTEAGKEKKKLSRQRIRETIWLNLERERKIKKEEIQKRCKMHRLKMPA